MSSSFRCAVIGCGWIGARVSADRRAAGVQSHAHAFAEHPDTELIGFCDSNHSALDWACRRWSTARGYKNLFDLLRFEQPEVVSICTPDETHYSICEQLFNAPSIKAIIIEKPITTEIAQARQLLSVAERKNILLAVNYTRRFATSHIEIKKRLVEGELGEIIGVLGTYSKGIMHNGSHWFDLVRWLISEVVEVEAWESNIESGNDPTCHVRVRFASGIQGFLMGVDATKFSVFELDILGSKGRLRIRDSGQQIEYSKVGESTHYSGYYALGEPICHRAGFNNVALHLIANTISAIKNEDALLCSGEDGIAALNISEAARISLYTRKPFKIENIRK